jgi:hypothetical protein
MITHSKKLLSCLLEHTTASNNLSLPIKITTEKYTELSNTRDKKATKLTTSA